MDWRRMVDSYDFARSIPAIDLEISPVSRTSSVRFRFFDRPSAAKLFGTDSIIPIAPKRRLQPRILGRGNVSKIAIRIKPGSKPGSQLQGSVPNAYDPAKVTF